MADKIAGEGGFAAVTTNSWNEMKNAENEYANDMQKLEIISGQTFEEIINGEDESIEKAKDLVKENAELIDAYKKELEAVQNVYAEVQRLRKEYEAAEQAAIKAADAAYRYAHKDQEQQQEDAKNQTQTTASANGTSTNTSTSTSGNTNTNSGNAGGGDGVTNVGDSATYKGGGYYGDSYGGGG